MLRLRRRACCGRCGGVVPAGRAQNRPWERDTVAFVASTTKGATAMCAPPPRPAWPAQISMLPSYDTGRSSARRARTRSRSGGCSPTRLGLPYVDTPVAFEEACAGIPLIRTLEVQKPLWTPGTEHLYHAMTYGFLVGEVVRRITGRSLGTFFAEEIARPLGLSAWIGLPEEIRAAGCPARSWPPSLTIPSGRSGRLTSPRSWGWPPPWRGSW